MSDSMQDDQLSTVGANDHSTRLVAASTRQQSLLQQIKEKEIQLEARRRNRHEVEHWFERQETMDEKRVRLEEKIEKLLNDKKSFLQRQTIAKGALRALDHSFLTNILSPPPAPNPRQTAFQQLVDERDLLSFALLKLSKDKSEITSQSTQLRKELMVLNRQNVGVAASIRQQSTSSPENTPRSETGSLSSSSTPSSTPQESPRRQQDELLLLTSRLKVVSFVLRSLIHESGLRLAPTQPLTNPAQQSDSPQDTIEDRMIKLFRLAGKDWDEME